MQKNARIGVALAAYKPHPDYFFQQLESIRAQTFQNLVCAVCFDSPIGEILNSERFRVFTSDPRFIFHENPQRLGVRGNFEAALHLVLEKNIDAIAFSDQDDIWHPEKLARCFEELQKHGPLSLVHSDMQVFVDKTMIAASAWKLEGRDPHNARIQHLLVRNIAAGAAMLFDAELARNYPKIPDGIPYHDWWYSIVASLHGGAHAIPEVLYAYRQHGGNVLGSSPYEGFFKMRERDKSLSILQKCRQVFIQTRTHTITALTQKLKVPWAFRLVLLWPWDLGLGYLLWGLFHFFDDRPLARACLARAVGKNLFWIKGLPSA